ncbi:MAG: hypothetical protein SGBAC_000768 [Bacillariaceae sp.]
MSVPKTAYSIAAANLHWLTAIPAVGCVATVLKAQEAPKEEKGMWMHRHKSLGLLTGMIVVPRVGYRLFQRSAYKVFPLEGSKLEHMAADAVHVGLYAFMTIMPASGIAMGYYGGKGLPFFWTTLPGITKTPENKKETGKIAGQSFKIHKTLGTYGKFLIPLHVGGAFSHVFKGQPIFSRILPWGRPKM